MLTFKTLMSTNLCQDQRITSALCVSGNTLEQFHYNSKKSSFGERTDYCTFHKRFQVYDKIGVHLWIRFYVI